MKKYVKGLCLIGCCLLLGLTVWAAAGTKSVQVRKAQLRQRPSFLGPVIKELSYGELVEVLTERPPWFHITDATGSSGWMHASALTSKRVVLRDHGEATRTSATSEETILPKAPPIITPTAMSTTLPRIAKSLNSFSMTLSRAFGLPA